MPRWMCQSYIYTIAIANTHAHACVILMNTFLNDPVGKEIDWDHFVKNMLDDTSIQCFLHSAIIMFLLRAGN